MASISGQNTSNISGVDGFFTTSGGGGTASTTPTFSSDSTIYFNQTITITNTGSYTNPTFNYIVVRNGVEIANVVTQDTTYVFADTSDVSLTRTIKVTAQEFGDFVESAETTATYTKSAVSFRYWRVYGSADGVSPSTGWIGIYNFRVYSGAGQTGTVYPENLTSNTSGEANGFYVDSDYTFSTTTYAKWKAFDSSLTTWHWTLSVPTAARNYAGFYFDPTIFSTLPTMTSVTFKNYSNPSANYALIQGSNTGAFAGEETTLSVLALTQTETFNLG